MNNLATESITNAIVHMWDSFQPTLITGIVVFGLVKLINHLRNLK